MSNANEKQIGGDHYKKGGEEHWDRQYRLFGAGYFIGCITKYVERYNEKNGVEDLEKAQHFIEKLIELESAGKDKRKVVKNTKKSYVDSQVLSDDYIYTTNCFDEL